MNMWLVVLEDIRRASSATMTVQCKERYTAMSEPQHHGFLSHEGAKSALRSMAKSLIWMVQSIFLPG